jgi:hypothetical protein
LNGSVGAGGARAIADGGGTGPGGAGVEHGVQYRVEDLTHASGGLIDLLECFVDGLIDHFQGVVHGFVDHADDLVHRSGRLLHDPTDEVRHGLRSTTRGPVHQVAHASHGPGCRVAGTPNRISDGIGYIADGAADLVRRVIRGIGRVIHGVGYGASQPIQWVGLSGAGQPQEGDQGNKQGKGGSGPAGGWIHLDSSP